LLREGIFSRRPTANAICFKIRFLTLLDSQMPSYARRVLAALRLSSPEFVPLGQLNEKDWKQALDFCDSAHLTLALGFTCREYLPEQVRCRIDRNLASNAERWDSTKTAYREVASAFEAGGLELTVLKGFAHCPRFISDPRHRPQGDLDLLFAED